MSEQQTSSFDLDALIVQLKHASRGEEPAKKIRHLIETAVANAQGVIDGIPHFEEDEVLLFEDDAVSIWHCRFLPGAAVPPHDHRMSAVIGVYTGQERNDFFENDPNGLIRKSGEAFLASGDVLSIGPSAIHSVACVSEAPCCGIHVYLGALTEIDRSLFDVQANETLKFTDENYQRLHAADV
ncbi:hypothetical protein [Cochlodiniinecator piscidefendens]|uniref:hypothetical protein n=1 Tax=Cochlodiniinecator piscidefendens TaxID=2715756 RepID=UPI001409285F|nr:hypothetical protein [Cochlodiniinecator piscidefendens]